jgi:hypothetical protein
MEYLGLWINKLKYYINNQPYESTENIFGS